VRYSRVEKAQPNREVIRVTCPGVMGGLTGFPVAGGGNTLAVLEVGRCKVGKRSWCKRDRASTAGMNVWASLLGAAGIPTGP